VHGLLHLATERVHLVRGDIEEVEGARMGQTVMVQPRPEPNRAVRAPAQQTFVDEILDYRIGRRERRTYGLGDRIGTAGTPVSWRWSRTCSARSMPLTRDRPNREFASRTGVGVEASILWPFHRATNRPRRRCYRYSTPFPNNGTSSPSHDTA
jgi:hypothetical protein